PGDVVLVHGARANYRIEERGRDFERPVVIRAADGSAGLEGLSLAGSSGITIEGFDRVQARLVTIRGGQRITLRDNTIEGQVQVGQRSSSVVLESNRIRAEDTRAILLDGRAEGGELRERVSRVVIRGNDISAAEDGIQAVGADDITVEGNVFHDLRGGQHPDGIQVLAGSRWRIGGNEIRGFEWQGIILKPDKASHPDAAVDDIRIENNLIHQGQLAGLNIVGGATRVVVVNNTVRDVGLAPNGGAALHYDRSVGLVAFNNLLSSVFDAGGQGASQHLSHNRVGGDLPDDGQLVDGGLSQYVGQFAPRIDRRGAVRPNRPDIGAVEVAAA
ncbi:MAG TPA: right-handed parallel beta-helix repeat-containing protein, partial [bacterium]|nr:right-handed parallel beta-helix repeat-containing protein [bacterium]